MAISSERFRSLRLLVTDVDGVLTDGGMYYAENGEELKKFNVRDGMGVALLRAAGFKVGAVTGERTTLVRRRIEKVGMDFCYLGVLTKCDVVAAVAAECGCDSSSVAFVGDELNDAQMLGTVGLFLAPADACEYVRSRADHVLSSRGGDGVLREAAEFLLRGAGVYESAVETYIRNSMESPKAGATSALAPLTR